MAILHALALLLVFQLIGEATVYAIGLPIPGPVLGMVLLLGAVALRRDLQPTSTTLLSHLSLLFVPAGVGVMVHGARLAAEGVAIVIAIVVSTVLALAATALTVKALLRDDEKPR
jgi:holin-like protein